MSVTLQTRKGTVKAVNISGVSARSLELTLQVKSARSDRADTMTRTEQWTITRGLKPASLDLEALSEEQHTQGRHCQPTMKCAGHYLGETTWPLQAVLQLFMANLTAK